MLWKWQGEEKYKPSKLLVCSDQVKKVAMGMKGYPGLNELDLGGGSFGHVGHFPIGAVSPQLLRNAFPNLVKINLSNTSPTAEQLGYLFSSLSPGGKITALTLPSSRRRRRRRFLSNFK